MAHGGFRPGAGRKPGFDAKVAEEYKAVLFKKLSENRTEIAEALLKKATSGDMAAIKEIHERLFGKAPQPLTGAEGGDIKIVLQQFVDSAKP